MLNDETVKKINSSVKIKEFETAASNLVQIPCVVEIVLDFDFRRCIRYACYSPFDLKAGDIVIVKIKNDRLNEKRAGYVEKITQPWVRGDDYGSRLYGKQGEVIGFVGHDEYYLGKHKNYVFYLDENDKQLVVKGCPRVPWQAWDTEVQTKYCGITNYNYDKDGYSRWDDMYIPESKKETIIKSNSFDKQSINYLHIPKNVKLIEENAFVNCKIKKCELKCELSFDVIKDEAIRLFLVEKLIKDPKERENNDLLRGYVKNYMKFFQKLGEKDKDIDDYLKNIEKDINSRKRKPIDVTQDREFVMDLSTAKSPSKVVIPDGYTILGNDIFRNMKTVQKMFLPKSLRLVKADCLKIAGKHSFKVSTGVFFNGSISDWFNIVFENKNTTLTIKDNFGGFYFSDVSDRPWMNTEKETYKEMFLNDVEIRTRYAYVNAETFDKVTYFKIDEKKIALERNKNDYYSEISIHTIPNGAKELNKVNMAVFNKEPDVLEIPASVEVILPKIEMFNSDSIYHSYRSLSKIIFEGTKEQWDNIKKPNEPWLNRVQIKYGNNEAYVDKCIYTGNNKRPPFIATDVTIANGVKEIKNGAFQYCQGIKSITIPSSVERIGISAFIDCWNLEEVILNEGLKVIDGYAFKNCSKLKKIIIPSSVTKINWYAFYGCKSLEEIVLSNGITKIEGFSFNNCTNLKSLIIPNTVIEIDNNVFNNSALEKILIPKKITNIAEFSFNACYDLKSIFVENENINGNTDWVKNLKKYNKNFTIYYYSDKPLKGNYWHYDKDGNVVIWGTGEV